ncbi:hypothetical protein RH915_06825 [Serpentinicella sp. ANB-PHB4]|uniref:hypothetical protein n=1 Tax=Serpentinicella sp. ANB-PHB4 TaxID=3074076 RepID=UPI00285BF1AE|nr:hypothetical protein [Serpentinicella sp. ANB-PHB4]MDR5659199.1 hypothetical protein [Serpentinicella sp. ANB-PHB4]
MSKKRLFVLFNILLLGFFLGLCAMNLFQMHTIDRLYRVQNNLTNQLLDKEIQLEKLNQSIDNNKSFVVKNLEIIVEYDGNPLFIEDIESAAKFYISDLVGREIISIDGEMIYKIFNNRLLEIEEKQINLTVKYIIITETVTIGIKATE